jgi:hypothetical protein
LIHSLSIPVQNEPHRNMHIEVIILSASGFFFGQDPIWSPNVVGGYSVGSLGFGYYFSVNVVNESVHINAPIAKSSGVRFVTMGQNCSFELRNSAVQEA